MSWKCDLCSGTVKFIDREFIQTTNSEDEPIQEVYDIYECDNCGDPQHRLIKVDRLIEESKNLSS